MRETLSIKCVHANTGSCECVHVHLSSSTGHLPQSDFQTRTYLHCFTMCVCRSVLINACYHKLLPLRALPYGTQKPCWNNDSSAWCLKHQRRQFSFRLKNQKTWRKEPWSKSDGSWLHRQSICPSVFVWVDKGKTGWKISFVLSIWQQNTLFWVQLYRYVIETVICELKKNFSKAFV